MTNINSNLSLWQLTSEHQSLIDQLYDSETGELNEIVQKKIDENFPAIENKCISITNYIRKLEHEEIEVEALLDRLMAEAKTRKKAYQNKIEKLNNYLISNMERSGIKEIKCPFFTIKFQQNTYTTDIININEIPERFIKEVVKVEIKADKNAIKQEVLLTGKQIDGANVQVTKRIKISLKDV